MLANQVALSLFFLYFVLMSDKLSGVINCSLQKFLKDNILVRHIMILLSIYLFTFVMKWYNVDKIRIIETFEKEEDYLDVNIKENKKYLITSFIYSILIYIIFILSTKNEGMFLVLFLLGAIILVFGTILTKSINPKIYDDINSNYFITSNNLENYKKKYKNSQKTVEMLGRYHNIMSTIGILLLILLLVGVYFYYIKQYEDHKKNWSWLIFFFGNNKCENL